MIVGLGNPGEQYEKTRHNLGVRVLREWILRTPDFGCVVTDWKKDGLMDGEVAIIRCEGDVRVDCLFPLSYMNESGSVVAKYALQHDIDLSDIIVLHDDIEFDFGDVQVRGAGSAAGHNGVRSIHASFDSQDIKRIRMGVGRPVHDVLVDEYVLRAFSGEEEKLIPDMVSIVSDILFDEIGLG